MSKIKSRSSLYNAIVNHFSKKKFRAGDIRKVIKGYSPNTYSTFLAKHCSDSKVKKGKNTRDYIIYFCRIDIGLYSLAK